MLLPLRVTFICDMQGKNRAYGQYLIYSCELYFFLCYFFSESLYLIEGYNQLFLNMLIT